ncbi:hypothetical protein LCGC14_2323420 [marine sediment metagenome]|uniref:Uncharacterized protein n=2 Tax=root TaxID=1 RepID=A0A0F9FBU9_9ZZZZ|nr:MAG: hypothetical protein LCMAC202_00920 [Marseillevirus LCMAC202]
MNALHKQVVHNVIKHLQMKQEEVETWIGEYDEETDKQHMERIRHIGIFIDVLKKYFFQT